SFSKEFTPINPSQRNKNKNLKFYAVPKIRKTYLFKDPYLFDTSLTIGLYYGIRFGINFDELFDFIVGFLGYDPKEDDLLPNRKYNWEITKEISDKKAKETTEKLMKYANKLEKEKNR
ncbi:MAG: hypothetical protein KDK36_14025, partial [Leptospiraceae bacterium]|nr:hypothetical protein [Leptospiraceae bacterium]